MKTRQLFQGIIDRNGKPKIPSNLAKIFGLAPGSKFLIHQENEHLVLSRPVTTLSRIYVEVTNQCNLVCRTCMRNVWDESPGNMSQNTFKRVLSSLHEISLHPTVFIGGYGEPLFHPELVPMVSALRSKGAVVELITNGTLLSHEKINGLLDAGLNKLWVSIDGATPASYSDVRLGDRLPEILANLHTFKRERERRQGLKTELGIAFVAMRRNIQDLPSVIRLGVALGATDFSVSNVLAHTTELRDEILYNDSLYVDRFNRSHSMKVNLPRIDFTPQIAQILTNIHRANVDVQISGASFLERVCSCPFVAKGSVSIRWDGNVSPCLPLMHTYDSYLDDRVRHSSSFFVGNINKQTLKKIWTDPPYLKLRQRLQEFDFSPCVFCNSCEYSENNMEDCFGNSAPACGGCLWAQGLIQCP